MPTLLGALFALLLGACSLGLPGAPAATPTALPPIALPTVAVGTPAANATGAATPAPANATAPAPRPTSAASPVALSGSPVPTLAPSQLVRVTGSFTYTNDFIFTYYREYSVILTDMYGFVTRDQEWEVPVESQVLGFLEVDQRQQQGEFSLNLPAQPQGTQVDVDNNGRQDSGVQIYAVAFWGHLIGSPFAVGDDQDRGWPSYLASTINDPEQNDEVTGGQLLVWSPDGNQGFPSGFGPDEKLFTQDDPIAALPAGYSVIDLDQQPFTVSQANDQSITLHEPRDAAIKDFSRLRYSEAFTQLLEQARREYAFNGIAGKQPDWDRLEQELGPRIAEAERSRDQAAYETAMLEFAMAFRDGHVSLGGSQVEDDNFARQTEGGYGFALRELDDGKVIVTFVLDGGPAAQAGMVRGAEITSFNGTPIRDAIKAVQPFGGPFSTDFAMHYQQQRYLLRSPVGTEARVEFVNPGQAASSATLTSVAERQSFTVTSLRRGQDPDALPVEFRTLPSGAGYIKVNSNYDDLNLLLQLFERALETFERNGAPGLIVDLRQNSGGAPLGLAGFLSDKIIPMGQDEYFSSATGRFEPDGPPSEIEPTERQFRFDKLAVLVSPACASACDFEAYGFSQIPGAIVVGQYPSAGIYAEVARGQFLLPGGLFMQIPTGRTVLPDGSILLEGKGVPPTLRVPITADTVLAEGDVVLDAAERAVSR
jgi:C-terminal processing protease CtpA/Prc